ncbi:MULTISPECIES: helix-turn-helix domain-containing protein [unclassified Microbacterium]|uniref:helix-turn-helix domain-containing protein n=1 Tax=unclassified Microbacterium TaxID=2609290 RepID=UPI00301861FD
MTLIQDTGVAARLRASRALTGMEQAEVAEALGIARNTVSNWETGRSEPTATAFVRWARLTGVTLDWLAEGVRVHGSEG